MALQVDLFTACAIGAVILLVYHILSKKNLYFLSKPIPCVKPTVLFGSAGLQLFHRQDVATHLKSLYNAYPDAKIVGFHNLTEPTYLLRDPEVIKRICVKDFGFFTDHEPNFTNGRTDDEAGGDTLLGNSLIALRGQKWHDMRATLSPAFTGSKMRNMFELVAECGRSMVEFFKAEAKAGKTLEYEMKDTFSRHANDVIATVAFGIQVDSMHQPDNEFYVKGSKLLDFGSFASVARILMLRVAAVFVPKLNADLLDKELSTFFKRMIKDNMRQREVEGIVRNDMIHILMEVRKGALKHQTDAEDTKDAGFATAQESSVGRSINTRVWTENELLAQCFLFFLAGFDTTSNLTTFLAYELTINPDIQSRLYEEIEVTEQSLNGVSLSYEALQKMQYMDMVVSEALRKWPPAVELDRYCSKDYLYDDGLGTRFVIEKGQPVNIPVLAIHHDPKYYPNPDRFDPERFSEENRSKIAPGVYIPFGIGPRNCIGSRLALMEIKSIVYHLLKEFAFVASAKTEVPLKLSNNFFDQRALNGVWLELKPRQSK